MLLWIAALHFLLPLCIKYYSPPSKANRNTTEWTLPGLLSESLTVKYMIENIKHTHHAKSVMERKRQHNNGWKAVYKTVISQIFVSQELMPNSPNKYSRTLIISFIWTESFRKVFLKPYLALDFLNLKHKYRQHLENSARDLTKGQIKGALLICA